MAQAVAVAPEPPADAADHQNDQNDDQDHSERHATLLRRVADEWRPPPYFLGKQSTFPRSVPCKLARESSRLASARLQLQRRRVDAVAQAGRAGAVVEDMAEV